MLNRFPRKEAKGTLLVW